MAASKRSGRAYERDLAVAANHSSSSPSCSRSFCCSWAVPSTSAASSSRAWRSRAPPRRASCSEPAAPRCDVDRAGCADPGNVEWHVRNEAPGVDLTWDAECLRGGAPVALASCEANDTYRVTIEYTFNLVTPILSGILGSGIDIGTEANAVVFSDALSFGAPLPEESTDPGPTVGPPGECLVPNLIGLKENNTDAPWVGRGFTGSITTSGSGNFTVVGQSLQSGTWWPCTSGITISSGAITPSPAPTPVRNPDADADTRRSDPDACRSDPDTGRHADADADAADVPPRPDPRGLHRQRRSSEVDGCRLHRPVRALLRLDQQDRHPPDHEPAVHPG